MPNWYPVAAAREMYEPFNRIKFSSAVTYFDQLRTFLPKIVKGKGRQEGLHDLPGRRLRPGDPAWRRGGAQDDEHGARRKTSYKRGATGFVAGRAHEGRRLRLVVLGTIIRETIGTIAESRKTGFSPTFLGTSALYSDLIHKLGGKAMDGLYASMTVQTPYLDDASKQLSFWATRYKTKFNEDPNVFAAYGYLSSTALPPGLPRPAPT